MSKPKSNSALFMYIVIALMLTVSGVCFVLYYGTFTDSRIVLWVGVASFTILYHFWLRIIMGSVTRRFPIRYTAWWFKERRFERRLYKLLRVRKWKGKVLTYDPGAFSLKQHSYEEVANAMAKAETDHWINQLISLSTMLFSLMWGAPWLFISTGIVGMLFDMQFILVQRFHRPIIVRVIDKERKRKTRRALAKKSEETIND
ncbi:MAG: hypothetical protein IJD35_01430 [Clostridia bacterium]|nr:hypothetical protein [Clostridia bacterium]